MTPQTRPSTQPRRHHGGCGGPGGGGVPQPLGGSCGGGCPQPRPPAGGIGPVGRSDNLDVHAYPLGCRRTRVLLDKNDPDQSSLHRQGCLDSSSNVEARRSGASGCRRPHHLQTSKRERRRGPWTEKSLGAEAALDPLNRRPTAGPRYRRGPTRSRGRPPRRQGPGPHARPSPSGGRARRRPPRGSATPPRPPRRR